MGVHTTAVVDPSARLGVDVDVGPYAIIGAGVVVGDRCRIGPHACLEGPMEIGDDCVIAYSVALGLDPQMKVSSPPYGGVRIGRRNVFREFSQVHRSIYPDQSTTIGDDCYVMATAHVGHDSHVGNHVVLCNCALLAGHVEVGDRAFVSGGVVVHQFSRIGAMAMLGGNAAIHRDVAPYCLVVGDRPRSPEGLNLVGLKRNGVNGERLTALRAAYRELFRGDGVPHERLSALRATTPEVERLVAFCHESRRGVIGLGLLNTPVDAH
jgi:UDP-N-acetylglucosamine acyltransferase